MRRPGMLPLVALPVPGADALPKGRMVGMRRFLLVMCAGAATLLLAAGAVWAWTPIPPPEPTMRCDRGGGLCVGTDRRDVISGSKAYDIIRAKDGLDYVYAKAGSDSVSGKRQHRGDLIRPHTRSLLVPQRVVTMGTLWQAWQRQSPPPARSVRRGRSRAPPLDLLPGTPLREVRSTLCRD